jgi:DNA-binding transcriptional ArsR family regulator
MKDREPYKIFFETLSNKTRWDIIHLLLKKKYRATEIARVLGYGQSLVSHHLRRLEICGFVRVRAKGKERIYAINAKATKPLLRLMDKHINNFCKKVCVKRLN